MGNSTCSCSTESCEESPSVATNATLKQFLMIGDSISLGMQSGLAKILAAKGIELTHVPGNAVSSNFGWHCIDGWLQLPHRNWDLISFNFGLHDLAYDTERISVDQYKMLMRNIITKLVGAQQAAKMALLWVTTTPIPTVPTYGPGCNDTTHCLNPPRFDDDAVLYNLAVAELIEDAARAGAKIGTSDLYSFVLQNCGGRGYSQCLGFQLPSNVHYTEKGWAALAARLALDVEAQLQPPLASHYTARSSASRMLNDSFAFWFAFRDPLTGLFCDTVNFDGPVCGDGNNRYSSAGTGMGLIADCVAAELGLLDRTTVENRSLQTLRAIRDLWPHEPQSGFFVHFTDRQQRVLGEFSTIDTAEMAMGALFAANYFGGAVSQAAHSLVQLTNWTRAIRSASDPTIYPVVNRDTGEMSGNIRPYNEYFILAYLAHDVRRAWAKANTSP